MKSGLDGARFLRSSAALRPARPYVPAQVVGVEGRDRIVSTGGGWTPRVPVNWEDHEPGLGAAKPSAPDPGWAPLLAAAAEGRLEDVDALLLAGADKDVIEEATGATPLLLAAQLGHAPVVRLLCARGALKEKRSWDGQTPLLAAASMGFVDVAKELARAGARRDHPGANGYTPLYIAGVLGYKEIVQYLLDGPNTGDVPKRRARSAASRRRPRSAGPAGARARGRTPPETAARKCRVGGGFQSVRER